MRKYFALCLLIGVLATTGKPCAVMADESFGRLFPVTSEFFMAIGYKVWLTGWQSYTPSYVPQGGANYTSYYESAPASMPSLSMKYKGFFMSASTLSADDFDFPAYTDMVSLNGAGNTSTLIETKYKVSRDEMDINIGYYVHPSVGFTIGYKEITQEFKGMTKSVAGLPLIYNNAPSKTLYDGVTFGVVGNAAIGHGITLYGNGVAGVLSMKFEPASTDDYSAMYEAAELGVALKPSNFPMSFTFGYKYQLINNKTDNTDYEKMIGLDVTKGFIFGVNVIF